MVHQSAKLAPFARPLFCFSPPGKGIKLFLLFPGMEPTPWRLCFWAACAVRLDSGLSVERLRHGKRQGVGTNQEPVAGVLLEDMEEKKMDKEDGAIEPGGCPLLFGPLNILMRCCRGGEGRRIAAGLVARG